jgi:DNA-binding SARP family transcriptional activator
MRWWLRWHDRLNVGSSPRVWDWRMRTTGEKRPVLEIRLLGELAVFRDGVRLDLPASKKSRALLAYLVATAKPHLRDHLCGLLWDGPDDPRAQLRWSLAKIRPLIDAAKVTRLNADRERVSFAGPDVEIDLNVVRATERRGCSVVPTDELSAAADRFVGPFIEGLELSNCHRFQAWCVGLREEMHALHVAMRVALIDRLRTVPDVALRHARTLLALDPLAESSHISVVGLLAASGRSREALEQYERCRQLLERELGARPSAELEAVRRALTNAPPHAPSPAPSPVVVAETPSLSSPRSPPLVGRDRERDLLQGKLTAAAAGSGRAVVLLAGDSGVGKSRLLEELIALTHAAGGHVLSGRAFEAEMVRPYGAWIDALRSGGAARNPDPATARPLASLLPELGSASTGETGMEGGGDRNRLFESIVRHLIALAADQGPLLVILDDLQWLDDVSAALLHFVARAVDGHRILIACAARAGELGDNPAVLRLVRALERERRLSQLLLSPLDAGATAQLVQSLGGGVDTAAVFEGSEGNPLFAIELARAQQAGGGGISETLGALIGERLDRLDERGRLLLSFGSTLGRSFDPELLARVMNTNTLDLIGALTDLERRGILRVTGSGLYDFSHDLVRRTAYQQMSEPRRRLVHLQVARALAARPDPDAALAGDLAHHAGLGGDSPVAVRAYLAAAERSLRLFAWGEATELARRGERLVSGLPRPERLRLHIELLGVEILARPTGQRARDIDVAMLRALTEAEETGLNADAARGYYLRSVMQFRDGDPVGAAETSWRGVAAGGAADPLTSARSKAETGRCLMMLEREMDRAKVLLDEASQVLSEHQDLLPLDWGLGLFDRFVGDTNSARDRLDRAAAQSRQIQSHWEENECLRALTLMAIETGNLEQARARTTAVFVAAEKMGEGSERPIAEAMMCLVRVMDGDESAALPLEQALGAVRAADAKLMLATLLNFAAEHDLAHDQNDRADGRAREALAAASVLGRRSQMAIAESILARVALRRGDTAAARAHLDRTASDVDAPLGLSSYARGAVKRAQTAIETKRGN